MRAALMVLLLFAALVATAKATPDKADHILIEKAERRMTLTRGGETLKTYRIALGSSPVGDKEKQGDGRTPEGSYRISFKNPHSKFHLSLKISYPDRADRAAAQRAGVDPGGDIFIHGAPGTSGVPAALVLRRDWTLGCIAVSNDEIEEIWRLVDVGTKVEIRP
jgi:murein L,D-transpeptidase YafK